MKVVTTPNTLSAILCYLPLCFLQVHAVTFSYEFAPTSDAAFQSALYYSKVTILVMNNLKWIILVQGFPLAVMNIISTCVLKLAFKGWVYRVCGSF